jgi:hypothetical protein
MSERTPTRTTTRRAHRPGRTAIYAVAAVVAITLATLGVMVLTGNDDDSLPHRGVR